MKARTRSEEVAEVMQRPYPVRVQPIPEDLGGGFIAYLPDFGHSACSAAGETEVEAIANLRLVQAEVVEFYLRSGERIPGASEYPVRMGRLNQVPFRVPSHVHSRLKEAAATQGLSLNALLSEIVTQYLALREAVPFVRQLVRNEIRRNEAARANRKRTDEKWVSADLRRSRLRIVESTVPEKLTPNWKDEQDVESVDQMAA